MKTRSIIAIIVFCGALVASAQPVTPQTFEQNPDYAGGIYHIYNYKPSKIDKAPKGYKPFYVSHLGRHSSRWHTSPYRYVLCQQQLNAAAEAGILTNVGLDLRKKMDVTANRAQGRNSEISPRGVEEQRGIAERMFQRTPQLFKGNQAFVENYSSDAPRCILTMSAFCQRLAQLNAKLPMSLCANGTVQKTLQEHNGCESFRKEAKKLTLKGIDDVLTQISDNVLARIYKPQTCPFKNDQAKKNEFVRSLFDLAIIAQDTDDPRFYEIFSPQEIYDMWKSILPYRYTQYGASIKWGDAILGDGMLIVRHILNDINQKMEGKQSTATLRFAHDYSLLSLLAALDIAPASLRTDDYETLCDKWIDYEISPMAANLQFILYRKGSDCLVQVLLNEQQIQLPIAAACQSFYKWEDVKVYMQKRIDYINALPAVQALGLDKPYELAVPAFGSVLSKYPN